MYIGPDQANKKLSFVYRDDVTSAALAAIRLGPAVHGKAFSACLNSQSRPYFSPKHVFFVSLALSVMIAYCVPDIGCVEQPTLKEYLDLTAAAMGVKPHYSDSA